jgi:hypothetical protein
VARKLLHGGLHSHDRGCHCVVYLREAYLNNMTGELTVLRRKCVDYVVDNFFNRSAFN